jgi:ABC-type uncharacterized transport system substrate-binding protein
MGSRRKYERILNKALKKVEILMSIFVILVFFAITYPLLKKQKVLIIQSYSGGYSWTDKVDDGINSIMRKQNKFTHAEIFLDSKGKQKSEIPISLLYARFMVWFPLFKPDIIICVDDNSNDYFCKDYINRKDIKIIFAGLNAEPKDYGYDKAKNVYGILERIKIKDSLKLLEQITNRRNIIHISDNSNTSKMIKKELDSCVWEGFNFKQELLSNSFEEIVKLVRTLDKDDIVIITHYHTIKYENGNRVKPKKVIQWISENSDALIVGFWDFAVIDGADIAFQLDGFEHGKIATKYALNILNNKRIKEKMVINRFFNFMINERGIEGKNIKLTPVLKSFAHRSYEKGFKDDYFLEENQ